MVADIAAAERFLPLYAVNGFVSIVDSRADIFAAGGNAQHTAAAVDQLALIVERGSGVENFGAGGSSSLQTGNAPSASRASLVM